MNKELITIIEALINRIEFKSHSGLVFVETKPEMCRRIRFRGPKGCDSLTSCQNCYFYRHATMGPSYVGYIEKLIQRF